MGSCSVCEHRREMVFKAMRPFPQTSSAATIAEKLGWPRQRVTYALCGLRDRRLVQYEPGLRLWSRSRPSPEVLPDV